jgi:hypothetical protein
VTTTVAPTKIAIKKSTNGFCIFFYLQKIKNIISMPQETGNTPIDKTNPNGMPMKGIDEKS